MRKASWMATRFLTLILALNLFGPPVAWADDFPGFNLEKALEPRSIGAADAPVVMHEYASLTCSHCADFQTKILPELKKNYIEKGKVRLVFHDYPLNGPALKAAAIARCVPEEQYHNFITALFMTMQNWAAAEDVDRSLTQTARLIGLSPEKAKFCLNHKPLLEGLAKAQADAEKTHGIQGTPSLVFEGQKGAVRGVLPYPELAAMIDRLVEAKANENAPAASR